MFTIILIIIIITIIIIMCVYIYIYLRAATNRRLELLADPPVGLAVGAEGESLVDVLPRHVRVGQVVVQRREVREARVHPRVQGHGPPIACERLVEAVLRLQRDAEVRPDVGLRRVQRLLVRAVPPALAEQPQDLHVRFRMTKHR